MAKTQEVPGLAKMATVYRCFRCARRFKVGYGQPVEGVQYYMYKPQTTTAPKLELEAVGGGLCPACSSKCGEFLKLDVADNAASRDERKSEETEETEES